VREQDSFLLPGSFSVFLVRVLVLEARGRLYLITYGFTIRDLINVMPIAGENNLFSTTDT